MASANSNQNVNDKLVIFKGDDTGGVFGRRLQFAIEVAEGADLTGCRAEWIFDGIVKAIDAPLTAGETREIFYSHNETERMCIGVRYGTFRIIDSAGKRATMTNTRAVEVTDNVARCYPGASAATVRIGTFISWENISGKPLLVKTVNGEAPDASGNINIKIEEPVLDDTVTEKSPNGVKSSGIWSWVKSLLPHWLTSDYAEPATVASVANKLDKSGGQMTGTLSGGSGFGWIMNRQGESLDDVLGTFPTYLDLDTKADRATTLSGYGITDGATKEELAAAVSTNNPAFVSAVQNTPAPEPGQGEDPPWGTWGTVGAAIAGLVAGLKWLKDKVFDSAGNIQDQFATDLLGKQVAISAMKYGLASTSATVKAADRTVTKVTLGTTAVTVTFPDADEKGKTRDFLLRIDAANLATGGSLTITKPTGATIYGDAFPSPEATKQYLVAITETAANEFYVRTIEITIQTEA